MLGIFDHYHNADFALVELREDSRLEHFSAFIVRVSNGSLPAVYDQDRSLFRVFQPENLVEDRVRFDSAEVVKLVYPASPRRSPGHRVDDFVYLSQLLTESSQRYSGRRVYPMGLLVTV